MAKARIEYITSSDRAALYTIWFEGKNMSEFADFYTKFSAISDLKEDLNTILLALNKIPLKQVLVSFRFLLFSFDFIRNHLYV